MATAVTSTTPTTMSCDGESIFEQDHARAQRLHDDRPEDGAGDRPDPAGERRAADDRGGDDVELVLHAEVGDRGVEPRRLDGCTDRAQDAHEDEREHDGAAGVDAAELGRLGVAAVGVHVAAEAPAPGQVGHHQRHADQDHHGVGDAGRLAR